MTDAREPEVARTQATDVPAIICLPDCSQATPQPRTVRRRVADPRSAWLPATRVAPELRDKVIADAAAAGLSVGAFVRARLDGEPGPRAKRSPGPDVVMLAKVLAELGKSGSNLNQIARQLNSEETISLPDLREALAEHRAAVAALMQVLGGG